MNPSAIDTDASRSALLTDLYQLTMMQAYHEAGMNEMASFELFFRRLPRGRSFAMAAGLEPALEWLEHLHFQAHELDWLAGTGRFTPAFIRSLASMRFTGDVSAIAEGSVVFQGEPVLRVSAPIAQAQLVESRLMNLIHCSSVFASKAARCVVAAPGARLVEFGLRRSHGAEAALMAARSACIAGFESSANTLAGMRYGLPLAGTMAHAFVQAHEAEAIAFENFGRANPDNVVLLIDTYDTEQGAHRAVAAAEQLARRGIRVKGVRLDSGDLGVLSRRVRSILDAAGLRQVSILASGDLDEWRIAALRAVGAPIDVYCVGTALSTSIDAPAIECAYKLVEYAGQPCQKRSIGKATLPGRKQVWRRYDSRGRIDHDLIALEGEPIPDARPGQCLLTSAPPTPARWRADARPETHSMHDGALPALRRALLEPVMRSGERIRPPPSLGALRAHATSEIATLPEALRALDGQATLPVRLSNRLSESTLPPARPRPEPVTGEVLHLPPRPASARVRPALDV